MKFTVLGKYGPYPPESGATSGYLLECAGLKILLDCGSGTAARLQRLTDLEDLDAVVLSHLHQDHMSDLGVLNYAMQMLTKKGLRRGKLPVYLPGEPADVRTMIQGFDHMEASVYGERLDFPGLPQSFARCGIQSPAMPCSFKVRGERFFIPGTPPILKDLQSLSKVRTAR